MRSAAFSVLALGAALAGVAAGGAAADEGVVVSDDTIRGWEVAQQSGLMGGLPATLSEFIPSGESFEEWTRMVTVVTYDLRAVKARPTPASVYSGMSSQYEGRCGEFFVSEPEHRQAEADPAVFFLIACDSAPDGITAGSGDYTAVLLIETEDALHMVQRAWRGELSDPSVSPLSDEEFAQWERFFDSVRIVRTGE